MAGNFDLINTVLFVGLPIAVCLGLILYLMTKSKRSRNFIKGKKGKKLGEKSVRTTHPVTQTPSPQMLAQRMILDETGMIIPELAVSEPSSDDFRRRIEQGIDFILPSKPEEAPETKNFGKLENLDPNIMKTILHHIDHLKNFRATYQLCKTLDDPNVSMSELSKIIVTDPILTGKMLKIANSAYFGMQQKVNSIGHALMIIGLLNIKTILYQDGLLKLLRSKNSTESFMIDSLWEHATLTSICASHIQSLFGGLDKGVLFTLGLLHDIGKFVMSDLPPIHKGAMPLSISATEFTIQDEEVVYGVNHAVVGRLLFDQWGFPEQMGRIIERHHDPSITGVDLATLDSKGLKYLLVLFLSNQVAKVFASEDKTASAITPLTPECHPLFQRQKLMGLVLDSSLFSEIKKAKLLSKSN